MFPEKAERPEGGSWNLMEAVMLEYDPDRQAICICGCDLGSAGG